jgi:hypothetical protein
MYGVNWNAGVTAESDAAAIVLLVVAVLIVVVDRVAVVFCAFSVPAAAATNATPISPFILINGLTK